MIDTAPLHVASDTEQDGCVRPIEQAPQLQERQAILEPDIPVGGIAGVDHVCLATMPEDISCRDAMSMGNYLDISEVALPRGRQATFWCDHGR
nr:hypothetical protein [Brucella intermedia]